MKANNFWNSCPKNLDRLPTSLCDRTECPWHLNSKKDNFCFWKYVKRNSKVDGSMEPTSVANMSKLLGIPESDIPKELEAASKNLHSILKEQGFDAELKQSDQTINKTTPGNLSVIKSD